MTEVDCLVRFEINGGSPSHDKMASTYCGTSIQKIKRIGKREQKEKNTYRITGDLTIKGVAHPVTFNAKLNLIDNTLTASGTIIVDCTRYGMKFRSGNFFENLGDTLIYNDFDLNVSITVKAISEPVMD